MGRELMVFAGSAGRPRAGKKFGRPGATSGSLTAANGRQKQVASMLAGGIAGSLSATVTCPLEVVKTKLQGSPGSAANRSGEGVVRIAANILGKEGLTGFFRGLLPTLVGIFPARATYFWGYSTTKSALSKKYGESSVVHILSAVVAGVVSNTITNPIWVLKTRMQLLAGSPQQYNGYVHACRSIVREEGMRGLFRGLSASYWGVSEGAIHFLIYERLKRRMLVRNELRRDEQTDGFTPKVRQGDSQAQVPPVKLSSLQYLTTAAFSKMVASALTYPHEVVRTRMREIPAAGQLPKYRGMIQSLKLITKEEGAKGMYAGMGTHLARVVPNAALMFLTYELVISWLEKRQRPKVLAYLGGRRSVGFT